MKRLWVLLLAACASHGDHTAGDAAAKRATVDASVAPRPPLNMHLPQITGAVVPSGSAPAIVIAIAADGSIQIATTGFSWDAIASGAPLAQANQQTVSLADLPRAVLDAEVTVGGRVAERAKAWISALDTDDDDTGDAGAPDDAGAADISMTYFVAVGDVRPPTPLVIADPRAPGTVVANVLDEVGGAIGVDDGGHLGLLALAAPWDNPGFGGVDTGDEERPSIDVIVGAKMLVTGNEFGAGKAIDPDPKLLAPALTGAPTATIDLLITSAATAGDLVDAVNAAHAAAPAMTTGVGATPQPFPQLGMGGGVDNGPIGVGGHLTIGPVTTADHDYAVILTRFVHRALAQLATCTASGKVTVSLVIDGGGHITKASGAPPCIADVFQHMTVARPNAAKVTATVELDYP